jgi:hypothetical protein
MRITGQVHASQQLYTIQIILKNLKLNMKIKQFGMLMEKNQILILEIITFQKNSTIIIQIDKLLTPSPQPQNSVSSK